MDYGLFTTQPDFVNTHLDPLCLLCGGVFCGIYLQRTACPIVMKLAQDIQSL